MNECTCSWKWLYDFQRSAPSFCSDDVDSSDTVQAEESFTYNGLSYSDYQKAWDDCKELEHVSSGNKYFYDQSIVSSLFQSTSSLDPSLLKRIEANVLSIINACQSPLGYSRFSSLVSQMESFLICMLGHYAQEIRFFAVVLLNCQYFPFSSSI